MSSPMRLRHAVGLYAKTEQNDCRDREIPKRTYSSMPFTCNFKIPRFVHVNVLFIYLVS